MFGCFSASPGAGAPPRRIRVTDPQSENSVDIFSFRFDFPLDFFNRRLFGKELAHAHRSDCEFPLYKLQEHNGERTGHQREPDANKVFSRPRCFPKFVRWAPEPSGIRSWGQGETKLCPSRLVGLGETACPQRVRTLFEPILHMVTRGEDLIAPTRGASHRSFPFSSGLRARAPLGHGADL